MGLDSSMPITFKKLFSRNTEGKYDKNTKAMKNIESIPESLSETNEKLKDIFSCSSDFVIRKIAIGNEKNVSILIAYIDGLVNKQLINSDIIKPLMTETAQGVFEKKLQTSNLLNILKESILSSSDISEIDDFMKSIDTILSGDTCIYIDGVSCAIGISLRGWDKRGVEEPPSEAVVRGPREGFTETLRTNTALLRRKIRNANLIFETIRVGEQTNTDVCISYIKGIANVELIKSVKDRIKNIKTDAILESCYIEEFIEEEPLCIFPTVGNSEKPDVIAAKILEGRIAILCDGTPFVLTVPYLFIEALQSSEDYYSRAIYSVFTRFLRLLAFFITTMLPALYIALVCFHQDIIPEKLLLTMSTSREGIPFSAFIESLTMVITFEIIREAGVRMPRPIGQAVSIVGALVIGDAAVNAGLVSAPMVIVIAITAITSFIVSKISSALLLIRLISMVAANILGILGIVFVSTILLIHMSSIKSFGVPYLSPITPLSGMDLKDTFVRFPLWAMLTRPKSLTWENSGNAKYRTRLVRKGFKIK